MKKLHLWHDEYCDINKDEIIKANYKQLVHCIKIGLSVSIVMSIFRLATKQFIAYTTQFLPFLLFFILLYVINILIIKKHKKYSMILLYLIITFLNIFGIAIGSVINPHEQAITFLSFIVVLPLFIFDKKSRMIVYITGMSMTFAVFSFLCKEKSLFITDIVNLCFFYTTSIAFYVFITNERIKNIKNSEKLKRIAEKDYLTGLYNRKKLFQFFDDNANNQNQAKQITGVLIADIDYFKQYNDKYGHIAGDNCIRIVSNELKKYCHTHNMEAFRYGGEEFVAVCFGNSYLGLSDAAEEIVKIIRNKNIVSTIIQYPVVTLSIGVATKDSIGTNDVEKMLLFADKALYNAKSTGRNKAVEYVDGM